MRDVKKIERKLCLTNSAAAKICSIANKKGEEKNKIFAAKQMLVYYLGDILVILRKDSYTPDDILLLILKTSPSLPRMVCRLNPATNIPITNNSPYRFGSVRAIFSLQRNFWVVRQLTSYANDLEL